MKMQEKKLQRFNVYGKIANVLFILFIIVIVFSVLAGMSFFFSAVMHSSFSQKITLVGFDRVDCKNILFGILIFALAEIFEFGYILYFGFAFIY